MGLFDFLKSDPVGKWSKRLMNKYQQTAERKRAIDALADIGTTEAVGALLQRYKYRTEATIVDEDEKQCVYDAVVSLGESAVPALTAYISSETAIYWPVKALRKLVGDDEASRQVLTALDGIEDSFGANRDRRERLVDNLREFAHDEAVYRRLLGLLTDEDEEIVIRAVDGLSARKNDPAVPNAIVPILLEDDTSHRVRTLVMELVIEEGWNVKRFKKALLERIPEQYFIDDTGVVQRR